MGITSYLRGDVKTGLLLYPSPLYHILSSGRLVQLLSDASVGQVTSSLELFWPQAGQTCARRRFDLTGRLWGIVQKGDCQANRQGV
jgi:hypothetical protein